MKKLIFILLLITLPRLSFASYSCKNHVVRVGDTSSEVRLKCGEPMNVEPSGQGEVAGKMVNVERWTYNPGYGKFYQILEFQNGVLISIKSGPRVK